MSQNAVESFEIERKYEVAASALLPDSEELMQAGFSADPTVTYELHATYYDTAGRDFAKRGIAVRQRRGGSDAGWHLKKKGAEGSLELTWPASAAMPAPLLAELNARLGHEVTGAAPIAELRTTRHVVLLRDEAGREAIELVDDEVRALDHANGAWRAWREWEAELAPGADAALLDRLEPTLLSAGAEVSPSPAKIARATGSLVRIAAVRGASESELARLRAMDDADLAAGVKTVEALADRGRQATPNDNA